MNRKPHKECNICKLDILVNHLHDQMDSCWSSATLDRSLVEIFSQGRGGDCGEKVIQSITGQKFGGDI